LTSYLREIAEQDDEKNRKMAEDLTKGIYRTGKSGKMGDIEFSDDEDEERKTKRGKKRRRERELKGVGKSQRGSRLNDSDNVVR
jgi:hypothetical protein